MKYWNMIRELRISKRYINAILGYKKHFELTPLPDLVSLVDPNLILPKHFTNTNTLFFNLPLKSDFDKNTSILMNVLNHCCTRKVWPCKCWKRECCKNVKETSTAFKIATIATATILKMIIPLHSKAFWTFTRYSTFVFESTVTLRSILTKRKPKKKIELSKTAFTIFYLWTLQFYIVESSIRRYNSKHHESYWLRHV